MYKLIFTFIAICFFAYGSGFCENKEDGTVKWLGFVTEGGTDYVKIQLTNLNSPIRKMAINDSVEDLGMDFLVARLIQWKFDRGTVSIWYESSDPTTIKHITFQTN